MPKKTYGQFCPIAYSLDLIGERWTLLIIRDLIYFGPERYSDLLANLPGIGTNLLAERLRNLEDAGLIQQRRLPPPAASTVYELTELGRGLEETFTALAKWGFQFLELPVPKGYVSNPILAAPFMRRFFKSELAQEVSVTAELQFREGYIVFASVQAGQLELARQATRPADFGLQADLADFLNVLNGRISPKESLKRKLVTVLHGETVQVEKFFSVFGPEE